MLAVVSENYFRSTYCGLEWEHYIQTEIFQALPGDGIHPIYVVPYPDLTTISWIKNSSGGRGIYRVDRWILIGWSGGRTVRRHCCVTMSNGG